VLSPAPLGIVLGSQDLDTTLATLRTRIDGFEAERRLAASTDFRPAAGVAERRSQSAPSARCTRRCASMCR
jgi:hypothetical protein